MLSFRPLAKIATRPQGRRELLCAWSLNSSTRSMYGKPEQGTIVVG